MPNPFPVYLNQCSLCKHANPVGARFCNACGVGLVSACLHCGVLSEAGSRACRSCGAILPDSESQSTVEAAATRTVVIDGFVLPDAVPDPIGHRAIELDLRDVEEPTTPAVFDHGPIGLIRSDPQGFASVEPTAAARAPQLMNIPLLSEVVLPLQPAQHPMSTPKPKPIPAPAPAAERRERASSTQPHANKKSARRAYVRRARLANTAPEARVPPATIDVLVLDEEPVARQRLCGLLEGFGFRAVPARNVAEAIELAAERPFAAAFLDIVLDSTLHGAGIELCQRVKSVAEASVGRPAAVILTSARVRPVDRVRASLAGSDEFLVKPLARGDVVRALDACEVVLPSDQRKG